MEIVAEWFSSNPEAPQTTLMLYAFMQLITALMLSRFLKRPEK